MRPSTKHSRRLIRPSAAPHAGLGALLMLLAFTAGCGGDGSVECDSSRECSSSGLVCDTDARLCVECLSNVDCLEDGELCIGQECVAVTPCESSRMCPGQVCDPGRGYCVDCVSAVDCAEGQMCMDAVCVDPPERCESDRQCSELGLVCNAVAGQCVECVRDADCVGGFRCAADNVCREISPGMDASLPPGVDAGPGVDSGSSPVDSGPRADAFRPPAPDGGPSGSDAGTVACGVGGLCPSGRVCCSGECVDPLRDRRHCGGCDMGCITSGDRCVGGECFCGGGPRCTGGTTLGALCCSESCVEIGNAACGNACDDLAVCTGEQICNLDLFGGGVCCSDGAFPIGMCAM